MKERKRKTLCSCHVEVISIAVETCCLWNEDFKDVFGRMHSDWTGFIKSKKTKKFYKPTTQESSSPSGGM